MRSSHKLLLLRFAALAWTAGLLSAFLLPSSSLPSVSIPGADKVVHFGLFAGFGWLWTQAFPSLLYPGRVVLVAGAVMVILTEAGQGLLLSLGRTADMMDGLADVLGLVAGVLAALWKPLFPRKLPDSHPEATPSDTS